MPRCGETFARAIAAPQVTRDCVRIDPAPSASFTTLMNNRLRLGDRPHQVWDPDGTIIWADKPGLAGQTFRSQEGHEQEDSRFTAVLDLHDEKSGTATVWARRTCSRSTSARSARTTCR
jgi:hypothetical protein